MPRSRIPAASQISSTTTATVAIAGGGIVGLTLALALRGKRQLLSSQAANVRIDIFEKASDTTTDAGAGMSMYPNGLRVLRDIDDGVLLQQVRQLGVTYQSRKWTNSHVPLTRGIATSSASSDGDDDDDSSQQQDNADLKPLGLCRWKLQRLLRERVEADPAIRIHHNAAVVGAEMEEIKTTKTTKREKRVRIHLVDGQIRYAQVLFGCDGAKSALRRILLGNQWAQENPLIYTGVTCLMGLAPRSAVPNMEDGITQVSSATVQEQTLANSQHNGTHAVFFPTATDQVCFQFHIPTPEAAADALNWGNLSQTASQRECQQLADTLRRHGWDESYLQPLEQVEGRAVRIGFMQLEKPLHLWTLGHVALLGDAAHPPTPYIGQGAQQGLEDVGVCLALLEHYCLDPVTKQMNWDNFPKAMTLYEDIRFPRSAQVLEFSRFVGQCQSAGGPDPSVLRGEILMNGTLPLYHSAANHNYQTDAKHIVKKTDHGPQNSAHLVAVFDELFVQSNKAQVRRWSMKHSTTTHVASILPKHKPTNGKNTPRTSKDDSSQPTTTSTAPVSSLLGGQATLDDADESPRGILEEASAALQQEQQASLSDNASKGTMPTINLEADCNDSSLSTTAHLMDSFSSPVVNAILEENWGSIDTSRHYLKSAVSESSLRQSATSTGGRQQRRRLSIMEEASAALEAMELASEAGESHLEDDASARIAHARNTVHAIHVEVSEAVAAAVNKSKNSGMSTCSSVVTELEEARGAMEAIQAIQFGMKENAALVSSLQLSLDHVRAALEAITLGMDRNASITHSLHLSLEEARQAFRTVTTMEQEDLVSHKTVDKKPVSSTVDHHYLAEATNPVSSTADHHYFM